MLDPRLVERVAEDLGTSAGLNRKGRDDATAAGTVFLGIDGLDQLVATRLELLASLMSPSVQTSSGSASSAARRSSISWKLEGDCERKFGGFRTDARIFGPEAVIRVEHSLDPGLADLPL